MCPSMKRSGFRAGSAAECSSTACSARYYDCPHPDAYWNGTEGRQGGKGTNEATYTAMPACDDLYRRPPPPPPPGDGSDSISSGVLGLIIAATAVSCLGCARSS